METHIGYIDEIGQGHPAGEARAAAARAAGRPSAVPDPTPDPIPMRLHCPACHELHIDVGEFATFSHHTHACQHCGAVWRPAIVATVGVRFLPGFRNDTPEVTQ